MKKKTLLMFIIFVILMLIVSVGCDTNEPNTPVQTAQITDTVAVTQPYTPPATTPAATTEKQPPESIKLMTYNLLFDTTSHPCLSLEVRGAHLIESIQQYMPDSVSFNETTNGWMNFLSEEMEKIGYRYACGNIVFTETDLSGPEENSKQSNIIFYRSDKYELVETDVFWLCETPEIKGSIYEGADWPRTCVYAVLKNKETGALYAHFGTHLSHVSEDARKISVLVIESYMREVYKKYGEIGIVLSGDFNDTNQSATYQALSTFMDDSCHIATEKKVVGTTASGYRPEEWEKRYAGRVPAISADSPIDYIFLGKNTASVSLYTVLNDFFTFEHNGKIWTNHPISDHYGVYCEAIFTTPSSEITYNESLLTTYHSTIQSQTKPSSFEESSILNDRFQISSNLIQTQPIDNLLKNNDTVASIRAGSKHGVWEIQLSADSVAKIKGFSFTTSTSSKKLPHSLRIYISVDGKKWTQMGEVYTQKLVASTTYYIKPNLLVHAMKIKLVFSDCPSYVELSNLTVYGQ